MELCKRNDTQVSNHFILNLKSFSFFERKRKDNCFVSIVTQSKIFIYFFFLCKEYTDRANFQLRKNFSYRRVEKIKKTEREKRTECGPLQF